ncbi:MAG: calcium/sodium antiporter [Clostridia bacterium]|nr:calcium/sodium antiporter [Clostridia bacterium]MDD4375587.1 calcium/sodium antiporter [Clostridia bacterium]
MGIILNIMFMAIGLILLIKGADVFIEAGSKIGKIFNISEIFMGLTFVSIGTSLPELFISVNAALKNSTDMVIGNIVGTNILNMCCILGLICLMNPLRLLRETIRKDIHMSLLSSILLWLLLIDRYATNAAEDVISRADAGILLMFFAIFMYYTLYQFGDYMRDKREKRHMKKQEKNEDSAEKEKKVSKKFSTRTKNKILKYLVIGIIGAAMVYFGAELVVSNAVQVAKFLGVSETFISVVIIAIGTSLPELTTSLVALKKDKINIAVGNIIGSNMFNTLLVVGTASMVNPVKLNDTSLFVDCFVFILVCLVLVLFTKRKPVIVRGEGLTLISIYIVYISYVIYRL